MIILVGPSASGKTEICKYLCSHYGFKKFITTTTRQMRKNEIDDVDYHFVDIKTFLEMEQNHEFIETTKYNNNYYGTEKRKIGDDIVLIIEPHGFLVFKKINNPTIISFFLKCDEEILHQRMILRGDKPLDIKRRLINDKKEFNEKIEKATDFVIDSSHESIKALGDKIYKIYKNKLNK